MFDSVLEAVEAAEREGISLGELAMRREAEAGLRSREEVESSLRRALDVMRSAVDRGLEGDLRSVSGLVGGDAAKLAASNGPLAGTPFVTALAAALAVQEVNAAMGVIVAAPTAGGAGVLRVPCWASPGIWAAATMSWFKHWRLPAWWVRWWRCVPRSREPRVVARPRPGRQPGWRPRLESNCWAGPLGRRCTRLR